MKKIFIDRKQYQYKLIRNENRIEVLIKRGNRSIIIDQDEILGEVTKPKAVVSIYPYHIQGYIEKYIETGRVELVKNEYVG